LFGVRFTHVDPFEDTESRVKLRVKYLRDLVSPTSIRSRILKAFLSTPAATAPTCFTHVDPFEDTERKGGFKKRGGKSLVSPTSIRSRILKVGGNSGDVEMLKGFHPRRSVRGY